MDSKKLDRINALARKARTVGLTDDEKREQSELRAAYIAEYRAAMQAILENTVLERPDGTREKLKKKTLS